MVNLAGVSNRTGNPVKQCVRCLHVLGFNASAIRRSVGLSHAMARKWLKQAGVFVREKSTRELVGCSWRELKAHIESMFKDGMNWDNRSSWHIDHIKPCALFDLTKTDEQRKCFHFTNLQPLWAAENLRKSDTYPQ